MRLAARHTPWRLVLGAASAALLLAAVARPIEDRGALYLLGGLLAGTALSLPSTALARLRIDAEAARRVEDLAYANTVLAREIEDRKEMESALRTSEEKYRSIVESIDEGYFEANLRGHIVFANGALDRIVGRRHEELLGMDVRRNVQLDAARRISEVFGGIYERGSGRALIDLRPRGSDYPPVVLEISGSLMRGRSGRPIGFRGLVHDVTERIREEEELRKSRDAAMAASIAKSEFLANMTHELRTPLNHVIGFAELMLDQGAGALPPRQVEYLRNILDSARHLQALISDVLDLSRLEAGRLPLDLQGTDPCELVAHVVSMVRSTAEKQDVCIEIDSANGPAEMLLDARKIRQVLYNLLSNAVKFIGNGHRISVRTREVERVVPTGLPREAPRSLRTVAGGEDLPASVGESRRLFEVSVSDDGVGIRREDLERIFERFEQVDRSATRQYQGTGLGLALARSLIELHGGRIWAESDGEGRGSTFRFVLPE